MPIQENMLYSLKKILERIKHYKLKQLCLVLQFQLYFHINYGQDQMDNNSHFKMGVLFKVMMQQMVYLDVENKLKMIHKSH